MKSNTAEANTPPSVFALANSLPADSVLQTRIDPLAAKRACSTGLEYLEQFEPVLAKKYPGIDLAELKLLPALCDEFAAAQRAVGGDGGLTTAASRALVEVAFDWRRKLMPIAESLSVSGTVSAEEVTKIRAGYGTLDNLHDVIDLAKMLAPHQVAVDALCGSKSLTLAADAAQKALEAIGSVPRSTAQTRRAADLRDRLGTLIFKRHDRLRTVVALMTSYHRGAEVVGPLLPGTRKAKAPAALPDAPAAPSSSGG